MEQLKKAFYPGSFDPITKGHMNIISQSLDVFDEVIIAVSNNISKKNSLFDQEQRVKIIKELYSDNNKIKVIQSKGASIDMALERDCNVIIRGLRNLSDYNYEVELSQINKEISDNRVNTVCFFADKEYQYISSSMVKELFHLDKDISRYVDEKVYFEMKKVIF